MGQRREARLLAVQFLYQCDARPDADKPSNLQEFWELTGTKDFRYAEELIRGALEHRAELDQLISSYARNWKLSRITPVDRSILRLALHEMLHRDDIPPAGAINEAIEIAKMLSTEDSGKFINGILDHAKKDLKKGAA
ncbi:MAG: transcription antitermination factor NusB [bacterium]